jgi:hydrogenase maturation protein HypF
MNGWKITVSGTVQGVGFRPFVYTLANQLNLCGSVRNNSAGVEIFAAGERLDDFLNILQQSPPPLAIIESVSKSRCIVKDKSFAIIESRGRGKRTVDMGVDTAVCEPCLQELFDPDDRRYLYPFINCTHCGPRYTIIKNLPYDRAQTSMAPFKMCRNCLSEFRNPADRRFHAQANCCPGCGPQYTDIDRAVEVLQKGGIVAIKGIGGYHLACNALDENSVERLRQRKLRDEKPFAVMVPDLKTYNLSGNETRILKTVERPILLAGMRPPVNIAPGLETLGLMLPYTPIHYILFHLGGFEMLVMTSGNMTNEPMAIRNGQKHLGNIADYILDHNREIIIRNDDSVIREMGGRPVFIRRSRGYAPAPVSVDFDASGILACGAMLKNSIAMGRKHQVYLSQYIGDLENEGAYRSLKTTTKHMLDLLDIKPDLAVCDMHPEYLSTRFAQSLGLPVLKVQHHLAHAHACMAENRIKESVAVVYDGVGYGMDGHAWGGEIFTVNQDVFTREHHLSYMPMAGGDRCVRYPLRLAAAILSKHDIILPGQEQVLELLEKKVNVHYTSGMGRLFDAASAILGLCAEQTYEGQAPMMLESASGPLKKAGSYNADSLDSCTILLALYKDKSPVSVRAARFHNTIIDVTVKLVLKTASKANMDKVCLSGGCFQNLLLLNGLIEKLKSHILVYRHRLVPANDGGIALGQVAMAYYNYKGK